MTAMVTLWAINIFVCYLTSSIVAEKDNDMINKSIQYYSGTVGNDLVIRSTFFSTTQNWEHKPTGKMAAAPPS